MIWRSCATTRDSRACCLSEAPPSNVSTPVLILIKHSLPQIEPGKPAREWRLSDEGIRRCDALAAALRLYAPDVLVSSDEPKAVQTAEHIGARLGLINQIIPGLHEHERVTAGFLDRDAFQASVRRFFAQPDALVFGEETANQAHARFAAAVQSVMASHQEKTAAFVAHGTVISLLVGRANTLDAFDLWQHLGLPSFIALSWPGLALHRVVNEV